MAIGSSGTIVLSGSKGSSQLLEQLRPSGVDGEGMEDSPDLMDMDGNDVPVQTASVGPDHDTETSGDVELGSGSATY